MPSSKTWARRSTSSEAFPRSRRAGPVTGTLPKLRPPAGLRKRPGATRSPTRRVNRRTHPCSGEPVKKPGGMPPGFFIGPLPSSAELCTSLGSRTRERDGCKTSRRDDSSSSMLDIHGRLLYVVPQFSGCPRPASTICTSRAVDVVRPAPIGLLVAVRLLFPFRSFGPVERARYHVAAFCVVHPRFPGE